MRQTKKLKEAQYISDLIMADGYNFEKRKIIIRAIHDGQVKVLNLCRRTWGEKYYNEIVPSC